MQLVTYTHACIMHVCFFVWDASCCLAPYTYIYTYIYIYICRNGNGHRNGNKCIHIKWLHIEMATVIEMAKMATYIRFGKQNYAIPKCNVMHKTLLQRLRAYSPGMFQLHVVCDSANHAASMMYYILNVTKL